MSLIRYQQATYAVQLREQLELAGCDPRVAALLSRAVGELIDHVTQAESDIQRKIQEQEFRTAKCTSDAKTFRRHAFDRGVRITLLLLAATMVIGVLMALLR